VRSIFKKRQSQVETGVPGKANSCPAGCYLTKIYPQARFPSRSRHNLLLHCSWAIGKDYIVHMPDREGFHRGPAGSQMRAQGGKVFGMDGIIRG
jgi:hypothetical protein